MKDRRIVIGKEVLTLIDLRDTYVLILADLPFPNTNDRTGELKAKLFRHKDYCDKLSFVNLDRHGGQLQSGLVFSNETSLSVAVKNGYMLGCSNMIDEVGKLAPNDTAYKRRSCHSGLKLLGKSCQTFPPPAMGSRFTVFLGMPAMRTAGWLALLLTKAGDVETKPGPTT